MAKTFTIFIETGGIKVLIARNDKVERWVEIPLDEELVAGGVIQDVDKVAAIIRTQFKALQINGRNVVAGVTGLGSLYRMITLPDLPEPVIPEAIRREAERVVPVSLDEVYLAYQRLPRTGSENRVFLAICPKNNVDQTIRTLQKAGLEPTLVDLAPLAICRSVTVPQAVVTSIKGVVLNIIVIVDRIPQVIRSIQIPGELDNPTERLATVAEEIERTIAFYNSSQPSKTLEKTAPLFVSGDLSDSPDSRQMLASRLGMKTEVLPSPFLADPGFNPGQFGVNIGLALKEQQKKFPNLSLVDFNVLPERYRLKHFSPLNVAIPICAVVGIGLIAIMTYQLFTTRDEVDSLRTRLTIQQNLVTQQQQNLTVLKEKSTQLQQDIGPLESANAVFSTMSDSLQESRTVADADIATITSLVSGSVALSSLQYTPEGINISGSTPNKDEVYTYARALRSSGRFQNTVITSISKNEDTTSVEQSPGVTREITTINYAFEITLLK
jgi:type IV pilus assembly protein PilM